VVLILVLHTLHYYFTVRTRVGCMSSKICHTAVITKTNQTATA